jgi:periplasmic protein TonB
MLENSMIESGGRTKTRKPLTVLVSVALHGLIVLAMLMIPIVRPQGLPMLAEAYGLPLPVMPEPSVPPPETPTAPPVVQTEVKPLPDDLVAPREIPREIAFVVDPPREFAPVPVSPITAVGPVLRDMVERRAAIEPPPPELPPPPPSTGPLRVSNLERADLLHQVRPVYPPLAKQAHVQGIVILEATIAKDGSVRDARIVSGHPLLTNAAKEAVEQWTYKPFILNGEPIEVITTVTVTFTLQ